MADKELVVSLKDLPFAATVKYLGSQPAKGLWGMKHTRKPVDYLVSLAKNLPPNKVLPIVKLEINLQGLSFQDITNKKDKSPPVMFPIDEISYGVQDLVYTRVFSMIVVTDTDLKNGVPFVCHSFVCESRNQARQITYALAAAFQEYGRQSKLDDSGNKRKKFAIDLRTPEEQAEASEEETEA
ncbi:hypothetical protein TcasGA2_TC008955 [Tribolium castaneum]|uniref:PID domain-containing protein n=1 Tax=Tribolium castaneum TaxID=7070 RepID=D6WQ88_TRICA|nr:PREDICTED: uncharacterized protein LOC661332 [Tribolium castaneum]EFA06112.1 hypothetical protein TcasGA2_TC008955 [Tribolium castaneum]|eukprot:XP_015837443.1 PREDICTED: uncharacterized protein LOC661332 [Tribolium castaneum]